MKLFARMSIRVVLGQIIGVLGFFLVALSAMELVSAVERNEAARRVASLAGTDQQLFATLMGFRLERGTTIPGLISEAPADGVADTPDRNQPGDLRKRLSCRDRAARRNRGPHSGAVAGPPDRRA